MTVQRTQSTYQVRLGWGAGALTRLSEADIVVVVDALGDPHPIAAQAAAAPHAPTVFTASLRNATATAAAVLAEQIARGGRASINLVLVGDEEGGFAVEDYLVAGAVADALTKLGIDHSAPDVAVATEGFLPLRRAVKHLFSASTAGLLLKAAGRVAEVKAAAEHDAEQTATRF